MILEDIKEGNLSKFWNNAPNIIAGIVGIFFILSLGYNYFYFWLLDISIEHIPLTLSDFTLRFTSYILPFTSFPIGIFIGYLSAKFKNKNRSETTNINITKKNNENFKYKTYQLLLLILSIAFVYLFFIYPRNKFTFLYLVVLMFFSALLILGYVFFESIKKDYSILNFIGYLIMFLTLLVIEGCSNILNSFEYIDSINSNSEQILLRTFEKGHLISDKDYNISFHYLDSDTIINFERNEELAEYFEKYHKKTEETENLPEKELPIKK